MKKEYFTKKEIKTAKFIKKCHNCLETEETGHICKMKISKNFAGTHAKIKSRDNSARRTSSLSITSAVFPSLCLHLNAEGKKVRDQATQTHYLVCPKKAESVGTSLFYLDVNEKNHKLISSENFLKKENEVFDEDKLKITAGTDNHLPFIAKGKMITYERHLKPEYYK